LYSISNNTDASDLDKSNKPRVEYEYSCVENFYTTILFKELSNMFDINPHVLVEVTGSFAYHLNVPKKYLMHMLSLLFILCCS
jgi:hypothetical protein